MTASEELAKATAEGYGFTAPSVAVAAAKVLTSTVAATLGRELVRGVFGVLGLRTTRRRR